MCFALGHLKRTYCSRNVILFSLEIAKIYFTYIVAVSLAVPFVTKTRKLQTSRDAWKLWEGLLWHLPPSAGQAAAGGSVPSEL